MKFITKTIELDTSGNGDMINITGEVAAGLKASDMKRGNATVFVVGSTAAITTFEFEPGLIRDMREFYEKLAPCGGRYHHDDTWGDANGFSHVRAALQGPSLTVPFDGGKLLLGAWQQLVLAEFDNRPRKRRIVVQMMGE